MRHRNTGLTRRDFLRRAASTLAVAVFGLPACRSESEGTAPRAGGVEEGAARIAQVGRAGAGGGAERTSKVVLVRDQRAVGDDGTINAEVVGRMLDDAVCALVGEEKATAAWRRLIKPADLLGIKTNVWRPLRTPPEVEQLLRRRGTDAGVPSDRIRVTDRQARRMLADCTALINVRPLRSHHWAGIGGCVKNYIMFSDRPSQYHPNSCESLALAWNLFDVKNKTRLNILLALTPQFYGRGPHSFDPRWVWPYRGMFVSFDPVAVDALGAHLLKTKRIDFFGEDRPITPTTHIAAAERKYGLGVADLDRIELIRLGWQDDALI